MKVAPISKLIGYMCADYWREVWSSIHIDDGYKKCLYFRTNLGWNQEVSMNA